MALHDALAPRATGAPTRAPTGAGPSRAAVVWRFLRDFRPGVRYDEFKWYDWKPGIVEGAALLATIATWIGDWIAGATGYAARALGARASVLASSPAQRSMRA